MANLLPLTKGENASDVANRHILLMGWSEFQKAEIIWDRTFSCSLGQKPLGNASSGIKMAKLHFGTPSFGT